MGLPLHVRAAALAASLSVTAAVIITVADIGHPPPDGAGAIAFLVDMARSALPAPTRVAAGLPEP